MKRPFRLNKRAISTVLATVFFLGIAISVAVALFIMSSTYNNLYQQQLQVREDRLRELINLNSVVNKTTIPADTVPAQISVTNKGSVTAHVVTMYWNDTLLANDLDVWIAPAETKVWDYTFTSPLAHNIDTGDRMTVSTDRGTTSTHVLLSSEGWDDHGGPGPGGETPYIFQIVAINPTGPEFHGTAQFTMFQRQYFYYVIRKESPWFNATELAKIEGGLPFIPERFIEMPNATSYDPQGYVGVDEDIYYCIWMLEFQLEPGGGTSYTIKGVRWAQYYSDTLQVRPYITKIPPGWPTFTIGIALTLEPTAHAYYPPAAWTITLGGGVASAKVGYTSKYGGGVSFYGGNNYENLKDVTLTLHVYNASDGHEFSKEKDWPYSIMSESPSTTKAADNLISIPSITNGGSAVEYSWQLKWDKEGAYYIRVEATGKGVYTGTIYTCPEVICWSNAFYVNVSTG